MVDNLLKKSLDLILKQQTNILSAAFVIMMTSVLSQILGIFRYRLLAAIFGPSNTLGIYLASSRLPDFIFQVVIAAAISSAFIPVFSNTLTKEGKEAAHKVASVLLTLSIVIFLILAIILVIFAPFFLSILNPGSGFTPDQMSLMANLMRFIIIAQFFFLIGLFFTALLQSYNHFFLPGFAAAMYNLGIIIGILCFSSFAGIYAPVYGMILGALLFILMQLPLVKKVGFSFHFDFSWRIPGVIKIFCLMWPRAISNTIFNLAGLLTVGLISFIPSSGRSVVIFDFAQTLAFAPVGLFGQAIAQAAFPALSREKDSPEEFKKTFITSFNQMLYIVLPISVLMLILRIPIVRLIYGASQFDWAATVLTGKTLAFFSISIFSESLIALISRAFFALHNTKIQLIVGAATTAFMLCLAFIFIVIEHFGIASIAIAYSTASITELVILFYLLDRAVGGFDRADFVSSWMKFFTCSFFTAFALYIPIKLLDKLVFDTTHTINLIILTGISSLAGLTLYLLLTWLFNVKEAYTYILMAKKIGDWRDVLRKSDEVIEGTKF